MIKKLLEILDYRELLQTLVIKELIARYHGSVLGYVWVLLNPFLIMLLFTLIFSVFLKIQVENYALFFVCAVLPWNFFANCIGQGAGSLISHTHFINKFYCPRELYPLKVVLAHGFVLLNALVVLLPLVWYFKGGLSWALLMVPAVMVVHILFTVGLVFLLSPLNVFYRDVSHLLEFFMVFWYFLTPIIYPLAMVPEKYHPLFNWNPMHLIISLYRDIFYLGVLPDAEKFLTSTILALLTLGVGWKVFNSWEDAVIKEL